MEKLILKKEALLKALKTLERSLKAIQSKKHPDFYEYLRDSVIKRFEYSIDVFWKFLRRYLEDSLKVYLAIISPREVLKKALEVRVISEKEYEVLSDAIKDRNLTSHIYKLWPSLSRNLLWSISKR